MKAWRPRCSPAHSGSSCRAKSSRVWGGTGTRHKGRLSPASGIAFRDCVQVRTGQGKTPMRSGAQRAIMPGKSNRAWGSTGTRRKGRLSPVIGAAFRDCAQARTGGKVRPRCSPAHSWSSCRAKKNPPVSPGDRFCDRGAGDQRNWVPLISSLKERSRYSAARLESIMRVRKISK